MAFKKLKVKVGQVTGTHTNFPTLIQPSLITGLGSITLAEAQSARFYSDVGKTTEIAREIVSADEIHVKVTSMEALAEIWMDYDGIRSDYAVTATYGAENVWPSNYKLVAHDVGDDSTSNGNDGTASAGVTIGGVTGQVGEATAFTVASNNVNFGEGAGDFDFGAGGFFVSTWLKRTRTGVVETALAKYSGGYPVSYLMRITSDDTIFVGSRSSSSRRQYYISSIAIDDTDWHKVDVFRSSAVSSWRIYIDGVDRTTLSTQGGAWNDNFENGEDFFAGQTSGGTETFIGSLDEMRVGIDMDGNWITTEYNNQNSNGSFWEATDAGGGGSTPAQAARRGVIMMM